MTHDASGFWNRYALSGYDALTVLLPYQELQTTMVAAAELHAGERVLVAGCGTGWFEYQAIQHHPDLQIEGLDFSAEMLRRATTKCRRYATIHHRQADLTHTLPFPDDVFDVAVMTNVLYTLPSADTTLREIVRVLRPGGRLIISDPYPWLDADVVRAAHLAGVRALPWVARLQRYLHTVVAAPALLQVQRASKQIEREATLLYRFRTADEARNLVTTSGFTITRQSATYAEQNWLLVALRPADAQIYEILHDT